jgi:hypothetical protein
MRKPRFLRDMEDDNILSIANETAYLPAKDAACDLRAAMRRGVRTSVDFSKRRPKSGDTTGSITMPRPLHQGIRPPRPTSRRCASGHSKVIAVSTSPSSCYSTSSSASSFKGMLSKLKPVGWHKQDAAYAVAFFRSCGTEAAEILTKRSAAKAPFATALSSCPHKDWALNRRKNATA